MWPWKSKARPKHPDLVFKSPEAFLENQSKYGETEIVINRGIAALVLDGRGKEFGLNEPVMRHPEGHQVAVIRIASEDESFVTFASTPSRKGPKLVPGDLVMWVPTKWDKRLADQLGEHRIGWVGFIRCTVAPKLTDPASRSLLASTRTAERATSLVSLLPNTGNLNEAHLFPVAKKSQAETLTGRCKRSHRGDCTRTE